MPGRKSSSRTVEEALRAAVRLLERKKIPYMVMGGLALSVWGRIRVTQDVDLAIALDERQEEEFLAHLQKASFLPTLPSAIAGHRLLICRYLKPTRGLPIRVDFFLARGAYQRQALRRAVTLTLGGRNLRVIAPEDLILYKLLADRPIDRLDVRTVVEEQAGRLDRRYLTTWAKRLGLVGRLRACKV